MIKSLMLTEPFQRTCPRILGLTFLVLASCSSGGGSTPSSPSTPPGGETPAPPPQTQPTVREIDFAPIQTAAEAYQVDDVTILIGDGDGVVYSFERGAIDAETRLIIASASKMAFGLLVWTLIETGELSKDSNPQDYIDFWNDVEPGGRSGITLDQLFGFVSGFNNPPDEPACIGESTETLSSCIQNMHDGGIDTMPGEAFLLRP